MNINKLTASSQEVRQTHFFFTSKMILGGAELLVRLLKPTRVPSVAYGLIGVFSNYLSLILNLFFLILINFLGFD